MDEKESAWLAGLLRDAVWHLEENPGMTIQVEQEPNLWIQVIPQAGEAGELASFLLNMPYREKQGDPLHTLGQVGVMLPPDTSADDWEDNGFATFGVRWDIPLVALALLVNDLLIKFLGAPENHTITVQIEYGFQTSD